MFCSYGWRRYGAGENAEGKKSGRVDSFHQELNSDDFTPMTLA
jgi:hypothetical protein